MLFYLTAFLSLLSFSESAALASKEKDRNTGKGIENKTRESDNNRTVDRGPNGKSWPLYPFDLITALTLLLCLISNYGSYSLNAVASIQKLIDIGRQ